MSWSRLFCKCGSLMFLDREFDKGQCNNCTYKEKLHDGEE